jgi:hypothetical protein
MACLYIVTGTSHVLHSHRYERNTSVIAQVCEPSFILHFHSKEEANISLYSQTFIESQEGLRIMPTRRFIMTLVRKSSQNDLQLDIILFQETGC